MDTIFPQISHVEDLVQSPAMLGVDRIFNGVSKAKVYVCDGILAYQT